MTQTIRSLPAIGASVALAGLFSAFLAPAIVQLAALQHSLCAGGLAIGEIVALHATANGQFWPLIMLASGLGAMTILLWSEERFGLAQPVLSALLAPIAVAGGCWIAQGIGANAAGHAMLMLGGLLVAMGAAVSQRRLS